MDSALVDLSILISNFLYDALGRDVEMNTTNRLLFYIYDNGKIEKKFIVE